MNMNMSPEFFRNPRIRDPSLRKGKWVLIFNNIFSNKLFFSDHISTASRQPTRVKFWPAGLLSQPTAQFNRDLG